MEHGNKDVSIYRNRLPDIQKIAVVRANALGDFIFVLPALNALHATYPDAEIVLLAKAWHAEFLKNRPSPIQRVVVIPAYNGVSANPGTVEEDAYELEHFFSQMQAEHFDLAFQMHGGGGYSNPFTLKLGAKMSVGLRAPDALPLDRWLPYLLYQPEVIRYQEVVGLVGVPGNSYTEPSLVVTDSDISASLRVLPETQRQLIILHPGASDPRRRWPVEKFAAVGDALADTGDQIIITGNDAEKELTAQVAQRMRMPALDLGGKLTLNGLAGLLSRSQLIISNDTGPRHLAGALGTATVGIYWCVNMIMAGPLSRTRHRPLISWRTDCPTCGQSYLDKNCTHAASIVADITIKEVLQAAQDLLSAQE